MLFPAAAELAGERVGEPAGAVHRHSDRFASFCQPARVGARRLRGFRRSRRPAWPPLPQPQSTHGKRDEQAHARAARARRRSVARTRSDGAGCRPRARRRAGSGRARRRIRPARGRAPRRRSSTSTSAIASLPAGTSGSSSSTASSGSTSLVDVVRVQQEDLGVEPLERQLELLFVAHVDDSFEVVVVAVLVGPDRGPRRRRSAAPRAEPEQRQVRRSRMPSISPVDRHRLRALVLGRPARRASSTRTMIEIPSPSEISWLRRRETATCCGRA